MNLVLWVLPPMVAAAAIVLAIALRAAAEEAVRLRRSVDDLGALRPALVELRTEAERAREHLRRARLR